MKSYYYSKELTIKTKFSSGCIFAVGCPINENGDECNGHGFCKTLEELAETRTPDGEGEIFTYRSRWDRDMVEACQCDLSWTGYDCSEKRCLSGVDPKRLRKEVSVIETSASI